MRKFYQTEWMGLRFAEFSRPSTEELASPAFYAAFYTALFARYGGYGDLDEGWRRIKDRVAEFIAAEMPEGASVLSVGCGLGYIEHRLKTATAKRMELHVHEVAAPALCWLGDEVPAAQRYFGNIPDCLPPGLTFDLVYMSGVDYAMTDEEMDRLIACIHGVLKPNGRLLLISGSFLPAETALRQAMGAGKRAFAAVLDKLGVRPRGQFWGWQRGRAEYRGLLERGGFVFVADGFVIPGRQTDYWVAGTVPKLA